MIPGVVAEHAAQIDVPVLIGYGAVDVSPEPRAEARLYRNSPDITTLVLAGSAHCHNMASSRQQLWQRLLTWAETVTRPSEWLYRARAHQLDRNTMPILRVD